MNRRGAKVLLGASLSCALLAGAAEGQSNSSWRGPSGSFSSPTTGNWNTGANWTSGSVPADNNDTILNFSGSGSGAYTTTNNMASNFKVGTINLSSSSTGLVTITGNNMDRNGNNRPFNINQNGSGAVLIENLLGVDDNTLTLGGDGSGMVTLSGVVRDKENDTSGKRTRLAKTGSSTFTLTNANIYTNGTSITGGLLLVNNTSGSGTGTGTVTVSSTGALGGTGTISNNITLSNTAKLTGGGLTSAGKLNAGGTITLASTSTLHVDIGGNAGTIGIAGTHFDQINLTSSSSGNGTFTVGSSNLSVGILPGVVLNQAYTIVQTARSNGRVGTFSGLADNFIYTVPGTGGLVKYKVNYFANRIDLTFTAVPEPTSGIVVFCGTLALMKRRPAMPAR